MITEERKAELIEKYNIKPLTMADFKPGTTIEDLERIFPPDFGERMERLIALAKMTKTRTGNV